MDDYLEKGKELMKALINSGKEAFFIGPAVRDFIMGRSAGKTPGDELEIITSACAAEIRAALPLEEIKELDEKHLLIRLGSSLYRLTSYASASPGESATLRRTASPIISEGFERELATRAYTIDCLCMDYLGKVIDLYGGFADIQQKRLVAISDDKAYYKKHPLDLLHTATIISTLGFIPTREVWRAAKRDAHYVSLLTPAQMIPELRRILTGRFEPLALHYLVRTGIARRIPFAGRELIRMYDNTAPVTLDGFVERAAIAEGSIVASWIGLADSAEEVARVVREALKNPRSVYDSFSLFKTGLTTAVEAARANADVRGEISRVRKIRALYKKIPIKTYADLALSLPEISALASTAKVATSADDLRALLAQRVLCGGLPNEREALRRALLKTLEEKKGGPVSWDATRDDDRANLVPFAAFASLDASSSVESAPATPPIDATPAPSTSSQAAPLPKEVTPTPASDQDATEEEEPTEEDELNKRISDVAEGLIANMATSGIVIDDITRVRVTEFAREIVMKEQKEERSNESKDS